MGSAARYQFDCDVRAWDFWRMSMRQTYHSAAGVCNIVFTVAMVLLAARFWNESGDIFQVLVLFACLLFPVIQPIAVFIRARAQAAAVPRDVRLSFGESGLAVETGGRRENIPWSRLRVRKQPDMVIVFSGRQQGYMLTNRVLGGQKEEFFSYASERVGK